MLRILLLFLLAAAPSWAQAPVPPPAAAPVPAPQAAVPAPQAAVPAPTEIRRALELLRDDTRRAELMRVLEALAAAERNGTAAGADPGAAPPGAAPNAAPTAAEVLSTATEQVGEAVDRAVEVLHGIADLPALWAWITAAVSDPQMRARILDLGWKLLVVFGAGILAERLSARLLLRWTERLDAAAPEAHERGAWLTRLPYIVARLSLDLVPVAAFAGVAWGVVQWLPGWPSERVILWTVALAYIGARGFMVAGRLLFSPASNHLRVLPVADETAAYATVWLRRIALVAVGAFALSEFALLLAMPPNIQAGILRVGLLVVSVFIAIIVLQNRLPVAQFLAARPLPEGETPDRSRRLLRLLRDRLADAWHVVAILWVVALWGVWALEVERGFERLLRASLLTVLAVVVAKLADEGARIMLDRAFHIGPDMARRYPGLEARANRYLPALKGVLSIGFMLVGALLILQVWGLEAFGWFGQGQVGARLLGSLVSIALTLALALLVWEASNTAIQRHLARLGADASTARSARVRTLLPMLRTVIAGVLVIMAALNILTELGVNVAPLLAGAGVIGLAVGFGSQTLVRDVITGIFLLFEDAVAVGDVVTLGGLSGTVEALSIRSIKLRALDGSIHIVPFSAVTTVTNQTRDYGYAVIDLVVDYDADTEAVQAVLKEVGDALRIDEVYGAYVLAPPEVMGVDKLTDAGVVVRARIKTVPIRRWAVARELNRRVKKRCEELDIPLSYKARPAAVVAAAAPAPAPVAG